MQVALNSCLKNLFVDNWLI